MAQREIKFKAAGTDLKGRQNGMAFSVLLDYERAAAGGPAYYVGIYPDAAGSQWFSTWGRRYFDVDAAKEFCQRVADGEINLETLRAEFAAEDADRERVAAQETADRNTERDSGGGAPYEFYIDGPAEAGQPAAEVTELELAIAVRCAKAFRPELAYRYLRAKKKRTRKKYAKQILIWYWGVFQ